MSERFFNNAGPVNCDMHYCLPPLERFDLAEVEHLIAQQRYFVLHAPRQTGKTSSLLALAAHLNQRGDCRCLYVNVESGQSAREDVHAAMQAILGGIARQARIQLKDERLLNLPVTLLQQHGAHDALAELLTCWAELDPRPALLFIDEIDALIGDTLIAVLRQLRSSYPQRPHSFPQSIILCGVRDVRDYRILAGGNEAERMSVDDVQYVADLGLVTTQGQLRITNLIYQEVIPRELIYTTSLIISHEPAWYIDCDGRLQMDKLLAAFQQFFREHSEHWLERFDYKEAGPQLLLQAFLQRIVNGGGRIEREYGL
ncbi:MAG: AAA family ATPase, partial [Gammaproteobacteria bacterium]|nr:AAA family ATPase [Gammaproteobacteria bacterium]